MIIGQTEKKPPVSVNASQLSNFSRDTICSSCRAREAAFG
ncbi:hypothetical protein PMI28_03828, partial [Pseudomonas sp. GM48]